MTFQNRKTRFENRRLRMIPPLFLTLLTLTACNNNDDEVVTTTLAPTNPSTGTSSGTQQLPKPRAKWTFIEYLAGDESVGPFGFLDLMKLQVVGSTDQVNIVTQFDRPAHQAAFWYNPYGDWTDTRRFYIRKATGIQSGGDFLVVQKNALDFLTTQLTPEVMGVTVYADWHKKLEAGKQSDLDEFTLPQLLNNLKRPLKADFSPTGLQQTALQNLGETNTGDPAYLTDFLTWAIQNFPADHYIVSLFGHGTGWMGYGYDYSAGSYTHENYDLLNMPELSQVLAEVTTKTGIGKIDLLVFHACLMGQLDVVSTVAPYATYALASEEALDRYGWDYSTVLTELNNNPTLSSRDVAKLAVDSTLGYFRNESYVPSATIHFHDLSKTQKVIDAVNNFSQQMPVATKEELITISSVRNKLRLLNEGDTNVNAVDLVRFMELLANFSNNTNVQVAANTVIDTVHDMVYGGVNADNIEANGLSVYFPSNRTYYDLSTFPGVGKFSDNYPTQVPQMGGWQTFLNNFYTRMDVELGNAKPAIQLELASCCPGPYSFQNPSPVVMTLNGKGLAGVDFSALSDYNGTWIENFSYPLKYKAFRPDKTPIETAGIPEGENEFDFFWYAWVLKLSDGKTTIPMAFRQDPSDPSYIKRVYGNYYPAGSNTPIQAMLMVEDQEGGQVLSVWTVQDPQTSPVMLKIAPTLAARFQPTFRQNASHHGGMLLGNPKSMSQLSGIQNDILTFGDQPFTVHYEVAPPGKYQLYMELRDFAGHTKTSAIDVDVDNQGLDPNYKGYTGIELGTQFQIPVAWDYLNIEAPELVATKTVMRIFTNGETDVVAKSFPALASATMERDFLLSGQGATDVSALADVIVGDKFTSTFTYTTITNGKSLANEAVIVHDPLGNGVSYLFTLSAPATVIGANRATLNRILETARFFERREFKKTASIF